MVAVTAAAEMARSHLNDLSDSGESPEQPMDTRLGKFFKKCYRVGGEKLARDVPTPILLSIMARALLAVRNCILGLFGDKAPQIKRNPVYRFGLNFPLQLFYASTILLQKSPKIGAALLLFLLLCTAATLGGMAVLILHYPIIAISAGAAGLFAAGIFIWKKRLFSSS